MKRKSITGAIFSAALFFASAVTSAVRADVSDVFDSAANTLSAGFDYIWPDALPLGDFTLRLGAGIGTTPDYDGSDDYRLRVVPLIDLRYKDLIALQGSKLRVNFLRHKNVKFGALASLKLGREERRNPILAGLGDIQDTVLVGAFVEGRFKGMFASAEFRQALGAGQGATARFVLAQGLYRSKNQKATLIVGVRADWNSDRSNQTNFGITAAQSVTSGLPSFSPGGGFSKVEVDLLGRYQIAEKWRIDWIAGYGRLIGGAADSPLVAVHGTANQFIVGIGGRRFF